MIRNICVYGASSSCLNRAYYQAAYELGEKAAAKGWGVVYGGGKTGVMGSVAEGTVAHGGRLIGVAPEFMKDRDVLFSGCTEFVYTHDMRERKKTMEELSDAFVVMPGGFGTLEEYYEILTGKNLGLHAKPIVLVNTRGIWDPLAEMDYSLFEEGFASGSCVNSSKIVDTVDDALLYIEYEDKKETVPRWMKDEIIQTGDKNE